ncbi:TIGR03364 family FAD-dependent oxidoreductase [Ignatzschineria rhizosphaerae]|uniref:TIGR03364 family FAD-dependent oxidoreductase n=1 Tax=Ignatzschineria rhizosphaerae TaxID=2923279 RepID=A0ABY3X660_9GAMM|nr:TIGR03364 family FAD-dependent oxidoreductase [Ignatzschineria rhizosphaerae]UNM96226.1 TIGR03364 family FAD-dependent oxidoreductase [Ignatzschineria rhizosphaerae]
MKYDVAIVGSGILGLSHAYAAAEKGLKVLLLERDQMPRGASIQNFGFAMQLGQAPGEMLELAKTSREIWQHFAKEAQFDSFQQGSLLFARNELEASLLESFYETRGKSQYPCQLLTEKEIALLYQGQFSHFKRALHGTEDQVIYSREAILQLAKWIAEHPNVTAHYKTLVYEIDPDKGLLKSSQGNFTANHIFVCCGHDYQTLFAKEIAALNPIVCRLQMLRATPTHDIQLQHALFTGLSCLHYDAFAGLPEIKALQEKVVSETPLLDQYKIHLLITPTPYGDLIIGDSHDYHEEVLPFNNAKIDQLIQSLAEEVLEQKIMIKERWQGVYGAKGEEPISILTPSDKVSIVLMRTGLGMSVGPALGLKNISQYLNH